MDHAALKNLNFSNADEYDTKMAHLRMNLNALKFQLLFAYLILVSVAISAISFPGLPIYVFVAIFIFPVISTTGLIRQYEQAMETLKESIEDFDFSMH